MPVPQIGLTGNIGSGKSTVARLLAERGAEVIDADVLAREATTDPAVLRRIGAALGEELVRGGRLDRKATATRVFADEAARERLEGIVHPWVRQARRARAHAAAARAAPPALVVHDVPLLYEAGEDAAMDAVMVVTAPFDTRAARVAARDGWTRDQVRARDAQQMSLEDKAARAHFVVRNDGDEAELARRVDALWPRLVALTSRRG